MLKILYLPLLIIVLFLGYTIYTKDTAPTEQREYGKLYVVIYTKSKCSFCIAAKTLLNNKNIKFEEIDITWDKEQHQKLYNQTKQSTVPYIFINDKFIGGYEELNNLSKENQLLQLVE